MDAAEYVESSTGIQSLNYNLALSNVNAALTIVPSSQRMAMSSHQYHPYGPIGETSEGQPMPSGLYFGGATQSGSQKSKKTNKPALKEFDKSEQAIYQVA